MQFIGAGGFSAVYASVISPPYDLEPTRIALKIVDDKVLNEVNPIMIGNMEGMHHWPFLRGLDCCSIKGVPTIVIPRIDCLWEHGWFDDGDEVEQWW